MSDFKPETEHEKLWRKFEESFGQRRWKSIRVAWPDFIQNPSGGTAEDTQMTLSDFVGQGGVLMNVPGKGKLTDILHPRGEVPAIIFREAILWMHKALHVLGASEMHVDQGLPTWSISSAYHGAYFAARSILAFFGVSVAEFERVSAAVDICRDMQGLRSQQIENIGAFSDDIRFRSLGVLFDHRQMWVLFRRILRTSSCDVWPVGWLNYFAQLDMGDLTKQRHKLHYQLQYWIMDDLYDFVHDEEFRNVDPTGTGRELFDCNKSNYSLVVCSSLTRMALFLFNDLCPLTNRLAVEQQKVANAFSFERHPVLFEPFHREVVPMTS